MRADELDRIVHDHVFAAAGNAVDVAKLAGRIHAQLPSGTACQWSLRQIRDRVFVAAVRKAVRGRKALEARHAGVGNAPH